MTKATKLKRCTVVTERNERNVTIVRHADLGPLHDLLLRACPPDSRGYKSITVLAEAIGLSAWAIHKWIKAGRIPPNRARDIAKLSAGRVELAEFETFVYA